MTGVMDMAREQRLQKDARLPSVRELADRYGVAKATVQQAIRQLVSEGLCYAIDRKGVFLAKAPPAPTPETTTVALVLNYERHSEETNPFHLSLYRGAEAEAVERRHNVLSLYEWRRKDPIQKNREVQQFRQQLAGFLALALYDERDCLRLRDSGVPVVAVDYETLDLGIDCAVLDNYRIFSELSDTVLQRNPDRIFYGDLARSSDYDPAIVDRRRAFADAMSAAGRKANPDDQILLSGGLRASTGPGALLQELAGGATRPAVICSDEYAARQLLAELGANGPSPGRDFLLAYVSYLEPQHSDMRNLPAIIGAVDFRELGREGMRLLEERIESGAGRAIRRTVGGRVLEWKPEV
jgi:GntR family transcriptional regulator, arabinose operon transcriptional repressor